jgi:hypothetical protein
MVLIMYRERGNGGIQGIVIDSFYMDREGRIASEFYIVSDDTEGEIKKIEDGSIKQLDNPLQIQKIYYQYYLQPPKEIAANTQK